MLNGCLFFSTDSVRKVTSEKKVLKLYGTPDVISEESGDLMRLYEGEDVPEYRWPKSAIKKFYYSQSETVITIQRNKVVSVDTMNEDEKERIKWVLETTLKDALEGEEKYGVYFHNEKLASIEDIPIRPGRERDLAICEFLLRRAIAEYDSSSDWYIDLDRLEVSDAFLRRFDDIHLNIYPMSDAVQEDISGRIFNKESRKSGIKAIAVISRWIDDYTAEVEYGHYIHAEGALFYSGRLKLQKNMWIIELEGSRVF